MTSLYAELAAKVKADPRVTRHNMARADLGMLLFNAGDALNELWLAAEAELADDAAVDHPAAARLQAAVEKLRPIFGERT